MKDIKTYHYHFFQYDLPFVQVFRAKRIKFRPTSEETDDGALNENQDGHVRLRSGMVQNSWWNCDGELLDQPSIEARYSFMLFVNIE